MATLKIHMTYQCTAECAHCRFGCTRAPGPVIDGGLALRVVREYAAIRPLDRVVLMGGEPGLHPALVEQLAREIHAMGIWVRIETNAFWAPSEADAEAFLTPLAGTVDQVMLSLDAFHEPFIDPGNVTHAVRALARLGIDCSVEMAYLERPGADNEYDRRSDALLASLKRSVGEEHVVVGYQGTVFYNGAASRKLAPLVADGRGVPEDACPAVPWWFGGEQDTFDLLILDPEGYLSKGCGIALGNVRETPLAEIAERFDAASHPIFGRLITQGPRALAEEAVTLGYTLRKDYADRCHLCQEAREVLQERYPECLAPGVHYTR